MALTNEEIIELKNQLKQQIQHLPPEKKVAAEKQIDSLSPQAPESMLEQQKAPNKKEQSENKGIFRRVIDGDIPSVKIEENSVSVAFMDIAPISKGHIIILPKKPVTDAKKLPTGTFTLAKKLSSRIIKKLKANSTEIQTESKFGENFVNIIPSYDKPLNINSPRKQAKIEDLEEIAKLLRIKKRIKTKKPMPIVQAKSTTLIQKPRRIP